MAIYREDIVDIELKSGNIHRSFMSCTIGYRDDAANRFGIKAFRNGEPETLGGNCIGLFIRADGETVPIEDGVVSGNVAYVTLPEECYAVEGQFSLAIKVSGSGVTGTMRIVDGVVSRTSTDVIVDPGTVIPSIEDLIDAIDAAVASVPAEYDDVWTTFAPNFSSSTAYKKGQYVTYNGALYRFTADHAAGSWSGSDATAAALGTDMFSEYAQNSKIAPNFNSATQYIAGQYVMKDGVLYRFINSHLGAWTAADAKAVDVGGDIYETNNAAGELQKTCYNEIASFEDDIKPLLSRGNFQRDAYNPNTKLIFLYQYRISARNQIVFPYAVTITAKTGFRFYPYFYNSSTSQWANNGGWKTSLYIEANEPFYCQIARTTENTSEVADVGEFLNNITVTGNPVDLLYKSTGFVNVENGQWTYSTKQTSNNRLRSSEKIQVAAGDSIVYNFGSLKGTFCYLATESASSWTTTTRTGTGIYTAAAAGYIVINMRNEAESAITVADWDGIIFKQSAFEGVLQSLFGAVKKNSKMPAVTNGKHVYVYKFGGAGNDWCFVRTPSNYNHFDTANPHPFVICNHGNGWVMDGTEAKANWTKRTMYVPTTDPDYIADPTEYNGTSDSSLWYSNPTIEALLADGYVVCGCENYGDALYGNNNCRNACVDFFWHMVNNWNVQDRCSMIGASNGALTSLNAAYILQGHVKSMVLQYPLTCLVNQYEHYPSHQAGIRSAYGITDADISIADLTKAVATHDPLTVDVVNSKKVGVFPATKLYYSPDDAVVDCNYNALALYSMLDGSNKVVAKVQCSGEHGDHSHFAPADYVAWFNAN